MQVDTGITSAKREDLSRETFDRTKAYRSVVQQQGRVITDADHNAQSAIALYRDDTTFTDVIGQAGYPKGTTGFAIGTGGTNVTIAPGRMYLDGILVENFAACALDTQPFAPVTGAIAAGDYVALLEAWERDRTFVDDPVLRESALGGPDTTARTQIVWRVSLVPPNTTLPFADVPRPSLQVRTDPGGPPKPCALPPNAGYFGLENQLYRVEIRTGGAPGTSTLAWSKENASIVAAMVPPSSGSTAVGTSFQVTTLGPDGPLGFAGTQWVELVDDDIERSGLPGPLVQILRVDPPNTIVLHKAPATAIDSAKHAKVRRWDQNGTSATATGIGIPDTTTWITIESGIQIRFDATVAQPGDYWLIPARTAVDPNGDSLGVATLTPLPARRVPIHRALLAKVHVDNGGAVTIPAGGDLRIPFPPLTNITASDVSYVPGCPDLAGCKTVQEALDKLCGHSGGPCTLVVKPGANWDADLRAILAKSTPRDVEICFETGEFGITKELGFDGFDSVKITGAGAGTVLKGLGPDVVVHFTQCSVVDLRDVVVHGGPGPREMSASGVRIGGAVTCTDCGDVRVERVWLACQTGPERSAACLTVVGGPGNDPAVGNGIVRVRDAALRVGDRQIGILLVGIAEAIVEDNLIEAPSAAVALNVNDASVRGQFRKVFLAGATFTRTQAAKSAQMRAQPTAAAPRTGAARAKAAAPAPPPQKATAKHRIAIPIGTTTLDVGGAPTMAGVWTKVIGTPTTAFAAYKQMRTTATQFVTDAALRKQYPAAEALFTEAVRGNVTSGARGIVVAGRGFRRVRISGNVVDNFTQGIVAGVSHRERKPQVPDPDIAGTVEIVSNRIAITTTTATAFRQRHAIFVGNVRRGVIARNEATLSVAKIHQGACDAIRIWGYDGDCLIVRENRVENFQQAIVAHQLTSNLHANPDARHRMWLASDNLAVGSYANAYVLPDWVTSGNLPPFP